MRRERKNHLKAIYLSDAVARWQLGQNYDQSIAEFTRQTEATDAELTHFMLAFEGEIIRLTKEAFDDMKRRKPPPLLILCQRLYDHEERVWDKKPMISRQDEFNAIIELWSIYYDELIVAAGVSFYQAMLTAGATFASIQKRIADGADIYAVCYVGNKRMLYSWDLIDSRVERILAIATGHVKGELQGFAEDKQNIHTAPINAQTDATLKLLFAVSVPMGQKTLSEIETNWRRLKCTKRRILDHTLSDLRIWAGKSWIVSQDDWLYRRALQHLWAKIKSFPEETRDELMKRLYEECHDAKGMCAQGHIARLANVLVGFDAAFKGEVSLQDRMADISRLEVTEAEKRAAATLVLEEFKVPTAEWAAWTEAF